MPQNLFALVRVDGQPAVRRIRLHGTLQQRLTTLFEQQKLAFLSGIEEEICFNGDWKPERHELLVLEGLPEAALMTAAVQANPTSFDELNIAQFDDEPIKAVFTGYEENGRVTVLVQRFSASQVLQRSQIPILGLQTGNTFTELTEPMFTLDKKLTAVVQDGAVKFQSFANLRCIFDLAEAYREATAEDLEQFVAHDMLSFEDAAQFIREADSVTRKLVHTITSLEILASYSLEQITSVADSFPNVQVSATDDGRLNMPSDKQELKHLLHFLLDNIYAAPLSGTRYLTNSKRRVA